SQNSRNSGGNPENGSKERALQRESPGQSVIDTRLSEALCGSLQSLSGYLAAENQDAKASIQIFALFAHFCGHLFFAADPQILFSSPSMKSTNVLISSR